MSLNCKLGFHSWDGCICNVCSKTRNEKHDYVNDICKICGQGTYTDLRDGKKYNTIKIGNQIWLTENLAYKPASGNFWTYQGNESYLTVYGYLYDWKTAKEIIPLGWHLPSNEEFNILLKNVGGTGVKKAFKSLIKGGNSGFSALFGGYREHHEGAFLSAGRGRYATVYDKTERGNEYGTFNYIGVITRFWSSSQYKSDPFYMEINSTRYEVSTHCGMPKENGISVRCIKD